MSTPFSASARQMRCPNPPLPPVTIATHPLSSMPLSKCSYAARSVGPDPCVLDPLRPFGDLIPEYDAKLFRRAGAGLDTRRRKALAHVGLADGFLQFGIQARDDVGRQARRCVN